MKERKKKDKWEGGTKSKKSLLERLKRKENELLIGHTTHILNTLKLTTCIDFYWLGRKSQVYSDISRTRELQRPRPRRNPKTFYPWR